VIPKVKIFENSDPLSAENAVNSFLATGIENIDIKIAYASNDVSSSFVILVLYTEQIQCKAGVEGLTEMQNRYGRD